MSQLSYALIHAAGYEGGRGDSRPAGIHSGRNNSVVEIPYGRFVVYDTGAGTTELAVKLPSASGQNVRGILLHDAAHEPQVTGLPVGGMGSILAQGTVWMVTEQAVTPADPVFMRFAMVTGSGTLPAVGKVRKDADTADAEARANCRFLTIAAAGGLVLVDCNLP